jgi:hypothetical protein
MMSRNAVAAVLAAGAMLAVTEAAAVAHTAPYSAAASDAEHARIDAAVDGLRARAARHYRWLKRHDRLRANAAAARLVRRDLGGEWSKVFPLRDRSGYQDNALHMVLLPTGKILSFGRQPIHKEPGTGAISYDKPNIGAAVLIDPKGPTVKAVPPPPVDDGVNSPTDPAALYCAGMALLPDGRALVVGGNLRNPGPGTQFEGRRETFIFDPWTEKWSVGPKMEHGRWYPTAVRMADGNIAILGGYDETGVIPSGESGSYNEMAEVYRSASGALEHWQAGDRGVGLGKPAASKYPNLFVLPNQNIALAGPRTTDSATLYTEAFKDRSAAAGSAWGQVADNMGFYNASAILRPSLNAYDGTWEIWLIAGLQGLGPAMAKPTIQARSFMPNAPGGTGRWAATPPPLNKARNYANTVILPDASLVEVGGGSGTEGGPDNFYLDANDPTLSTLLRPEILKAGGRRWVLGNPQNEWRTYHSTALLLPDGRVLSAGDDFHEGIFRSSSTPSGFDVLAAVPDSTRRDSFEIYSPPYLYNGNRPAKRPRISSAPRTVRYKKRFTVRTKQAGIRGSRRVARAVLMAPSTVTHSNDPQQRLVPLRVTRTVRGRSITVVAPPGTGVAPPGPYMLFLLDRSGTPSVAKWISVGARAHGR